MWRLPVVLLVALVGCGPPRDGSSNPDVDGGIDAKVVLDAFVPPGQSRVPFMTTGTTPAGSLADVQFIDIHFMPLRFGLAMAFGFRPSDHCGFTGPARST